MGQKKAILKWNQVSLNTSGHGDERTEGLFARISILGLSQLHSQLLPSHLVCNKHWECVFKYIW